MVLRSAILGLTLSIAVIIALVFYPQQTTDPFLEELKDLAVTGDQLPPILYPMFPWDADQPEEIIAPPQDLIRISKDPQSREISVGNSLTFRLTLENLGGKTLRDLTVEDRFDTSLFSVLNAQGGTIEENRITWQVPVMFPDQIWTANYVLKAKESMASAPTEATAYVFGEMLSDMTSTKRLATSSITIIPLPETGIEIPWGFRWAFGMLSLQ